jgi:hypothetical protein
MKYSILTSCNVYKFNWLKNYVKSINSQIILADELIFIDDGSKNSHLIEQFLKKNLNPLINIIFIKNFLNLGMIKSLNKGLKRINNKIIFRLDIDDTWNKNHSNYNLNFYKRDKNYLIYSNNWKDHFSGLADLNLLLDNPTVHSSWIINKNLCINFKYYPALPEDFSTLSYYYRKNFKFKLVKKKTINYFFSNTGQSKKIFANRDFKLTKKKNLIFNLKKFSYFNLIKNLGFFGILKFIIK